MGSMHCLFLPQKLVFAENYGVGPSWLPATRLKIMGKVSCEAGAQKDQCDIARSTGIKAFHSV